MQIRITKTFHILSKRFSTITIEEGSIYEAWEENGQVFISLPGREHLPFKTISMSESKFFEYELITNEGE